MKKLVVFSYDDHEAMVSMVKDSINELNRMDESQKSHSTYYVLVKLTEVLDALTKEET